MTALLKSSTVGIFGGMGPAAGVDFARRFLVACESLMKASGIAVNDQAYPEHWLAQVPLPDRTAALLAGEASPFPGMLVALEQLSSLGARAVAIACNTAHAWHHEMQERFPHIELLHIAHVTAQSLLSQRVDAVGVLATLGTHRIGLYESALDRVGIKCHAPNEAEQSNVMRGIHAVKSGDLVLARSIFEQVASALVRRHAVTVLLLACTEIPLALRQLPLHRDVRLIDPSDALAQALARTAYRSDQPVATSLQRGTHDLKT